MKTTTHITKRVFDITRISEEEGLVLRTLLNMNDNEVKDRLLSDKEYWIDKIPIENDAIVIGEEIVAVIMGMVDGEE